MKSTVIFFFCVCNWPSTLILWESIRRLSEFYPMNCILYIWSQCSCSGRLNKLILIRFVKWAELYIFEECTQCTLYMQIKSSEGDTFIVKVLFFIFVFFSLLVCILVSLVFAVFFFEHETIFILSEIPPQTITSEKGTEWSKDLQTNWVEKHWNPHVQSK